MNQGPWECGWFVAGMSTAEEVPPELSFEAMLSGQTRFRNDNQALQHLVGNREYIPLCSREYH